MLLWKSLVSLRGTLCFLMTDNRRAISASRIPVRHERLVNAVFDKAAIAASASIRPRNPSQTVSTQLSQSKFQTTFLYGRGNAPACTTYCQGWFKHLKTVPLFATNGPTDLATGLQVDGLTEEESAHCTDGPRCVAQGGQEDLPKESTTKRPSHSPQRSSSVSAALKGSKIGERTFTPLHRLEEEATALQAAPQAGNMQCRHTPVLASVCGHDSSQLAHRKVGSLYCAR